MTDWRRLEDRIGACAPFTRRPVAVTFLDSAPEGVARFTGSQPSGCSSRRLAAEGRTFYTVPSDHFNCAVGSYTHSIDLSPERATETTQTLEFMFRVNYIRPEEVAGIPAFHILRLRCSIPSWPTLRCPRASSCSRVVRRRPCGFTKRRFGRANLARCLPLVAVPVWRCPRRWRTARSRVSGVSAIV